LINDPYDLVLEKITFKPTNDFTTTCIFKAIKGDPKEKKKRKKKNKGKSLEKIKPLKSFNRKATKYRLAAEGNR
jgi:hypothetical protein